MSTTSNKSDELSVSLSLINDKLNFIAKADGDMTVAIDYVPPFGDNLGFTSLELLLMSLSSCYGSSMLLLLRKMNKTILGFEIQASGKRRSVHPTSFEKIKLEVTIKSEDVKPEDLSRAAKISEDSLCPVYDMLRNNVEIETSFFII
ncbi:MAG: OsmC family protein [bacterium]